MLASLLAPPVHQPPPQLACWRSLLPLRPLRQTRWTCLRTWERVWRLWLQACSHALRWERCVRCSHCASLLHLLSLPLLTLSLPRQVDAMRRVLGTIAFDGVVVIGESATHARARPGLARTRSHPRARQ